MTPYIALSTTITKAIFTKELAHVYKMTGSTFCHSNMNTTIHKHGCLQKHFCKRSKAFTSEKRNNNKKKKKKKKNAERGI